MKNRKPWTSFSFSNKYFHIFNIQKNSFIDCWCLNYLLTSFILCWISCKYNADLLQRDKAATLNKLKSRMFWLPVILRTTITSVQLLLWLNWYFVGTKFNQKLTRIFSRSSRVRCFCVWRPIDAESPPLLEFAHAFHQAQ